MTEKMEVTSSQSSSNDEFQRVELKEENRVKVTVLPQTEVQGQEKNIACEGRCSSQNINKSTVLSQSDDCVPEEIKEIENRDVEVSTNIKSMLKKLEDDFKTHDQRVDKIQAKMDGYAARFFEVVKSHSIEHERQCRDMHDKVKKTIVEDVGEHHKQVKKEVIEIKTEVDKLKGEFNQKFDSLAAMMTTIVQSIGTQLDTIMKEQKSSKETMLDLCQKVSIIEASKQQNIKDILQENCEAAQAKCEEQLKQIMKDGMIEISSNVQEQVVESSERHSEQLALMQQSVEGFDQRCLDIEKQAALRHDEFLKQIESCQQHSCEETHVRQQQELTRQVSDVNEDLSKQIEELCVRNEENLIKTENRLKEEIERKTVEMQRQELEHHDESMRQVAILTYHTRRSNTRESVSDDVQSQDGLSMPISPPVLTNHRGEQISQPEEDSACQIPSGSMVLLSIECHSLVSDDDGQDSDSDLQVDCPDGEDDTQNSSSTSPESTDVVVVPPGGQLSLASNRGEPHSREEYEELKLSAHKRVKESVRIILDSHVKLAEKLLSMLHTSQETQNEEWQQLLSILSCYKVDISYGCVVLHAFPTNIGKAKNLFKIAKTGELAHRLRQLLLTEDILKQADVRCARLDVVAVEQDFVDIFKELDQSSSAQYLSEKERSHPRRPGTVRIVIDDENEEAVQALLQYLSSGSSDHQDSGSQGDTAAKDSGSHGGTAAKDSGSHGDTAAKDSGSHGGTAAKDSGSHGDTAAKDFGGLGVTLSVDSGIHGDTAAKDSGSHGGTTAKDSGSHVGDGQAAASAALGYTITDVREGCIILDLKMTNQDEADELLDKLQSGQIDDIIRRIAQPIITTTDTLQINYFDKDLTEVIKEFESPVPFEHCSAETSEVTTSRETDDIIGLSPPPSDIFVGNDAIHDRIYNSYRVCKQDILEDVSKDNLIHVLSGVGGIGKTEVAIQYAYRYHRDYPSGLYWMNAATMTALDHGFSTIFQNLNLGSTLDDGQTCITARQTKSQALTWLESNPGWLLILDDVTDLELIKHYFPVFPSKGHIIITTRHAKFKEHFPGVREDITIGPLSKAASMKLLLCCQGTPTTQVYTTLRQMEGEDRQNYQALQVLVEELENLPLAIKSAGCYIKEKRSSFVTYRQQYQMMSLILSQDSNGVDEDNDDTTVSDEKINDVDEPDDETESFEVTDQSKKQSSAVQEITVNLPQVVSFRTCIWKLVRRDVKSHPNGVAALTMLNTLSFFASTISKSVVVNGATLLVKHTESMDRLAEDLYVGSEDKRARQHQESERNFIDLLLLILCHHNLALTSDRKPSVFSIPKVIQDMVKQSLQRKISRYVQAVNNATMVLKTTFPKKSEMIGLTVPLPPEKEEIILHTAALQNTFTKQFVETMKKDLEDPVPLFNNVGYYLRSVKRRPRTAEPIFETSFRVAEALLTLKPDHIKYKKLAEAHFKLGNVYFDVAKITDALEHQQKATELIEKADQEVQKKHQAVIPWSAGSFGNSSLRIKVDLRDTMNQILMSDCIPKVLFHLERCRFLQNLLSEVVTNSRWLFQGLMQHKACITDDENKPEVRQATAIEPQNEDKVSQSENLKCSLESTSEQRRMKCVGVDTEVHQQDPDKPGSSHNEMRNTQNYEDLENKKSESARSLVLRTDMSVQVYEKWNNILTLPGSFRILDHMRKSYKSEDIFESYSDMAPNARIKNKQYMKRPVVRSEENCHRSLATGKVTENKLILCVDMYAHNNFNSIIV